MLDVLMLVGGLGLLVVGGEWLVRGSVSLARSFGVPSLIVGLTVVAFGTSAPELVVNLVAAWRGQSDVGFGNIVGSNIANVGLLLGMTALVRPLPVQRDLLRRDLPMMLLSTVVVLILAEDQRLTGRETDQFNRDDGIVLLTLFGVFLYATLMAAWSKREDDLPAVGPAAPAAVPTSAMPRWKATLFVVLGLVLLTVGGQWTVAAAESLAIAAGIPQVVVALTVVAVGTSLPELVTCVLAARKGETDLAVGNIVGSNIYNLLLVFGLTATISPVTLPPAGVIDLLVMLVFSAALLPLALTGRRLNRAEGLGLLASYVVYTGWLVRGAL
jgi:cation:H+ antiporter